MVAPYEKSIENVINLPNHQFSQYPQLPSFSRPTFDILKENLYETNTDWLCYESSGARHAYPSAALLGQPMVPDPHVPTKNLPINDPFFKLENRSKEETHKLPQIQNDRPSDENETIPSTTFSHAAQSAPVKAPETPTKPTAKKVMRPHITPQTKSSRSSWLPVSLEEQDRRSDKEAASPRTPRVPTTAKVPSTGSLQGSPDSQPRPSLPTSSNKPTATPILTIGPAVDGNLDISDSDSLPLESPSVTWKIPVKDGGGPEITISSTTRQVTCSEGVTDFCLFEGTSQVTVQNLNPQVILESGAHTVNIGDIYTHTCMAVSSANSKTIQVWMFSAAGLWKDVTEALNEHSHICHPKTTKLTLWMKMGSRPNYIKVDTYKRYVRSGDV